MAWHGMAFLARRHVWMVVMALARYFAGTSAFIRSNAAGSNASVRSTRMRSQFASPTVSTLSFLGPSHHAFRRHYVGARRNNNAPPIIISFFSLPGSGGHSTQHRHDHYLQLYSTANGSDDDRRDDEESFNQQQQSQPQPLENLYAEWSLENDQLLWEHRDESLADLAALLGRGLRGVKARLAKLRDVNSPAYERLFAKHSGNNITGGDYSNESNEKRKLVPVSEVLRRIQWDYLLSPADFFILHYDRVDNVIVESPMDAPNRSVKGSSTQLVDALPEHRIMAIKYKEQIVWDRQKRMDKVFAAGGHGGIEAVMQNYDEWKRQKDANEEWLWQRQSQVATKVRQILGLERYAMFKEISNELQSNLQQLQEAAVSPKREAETYVETALDLFRQVLDDPSASLEPSLIPRTDMEAVECLSELVALSPNALLRQHVLAELTLVLNRLDNGKQQQKQQSSTSLLNRELPEIPEEEITETFVRGSGPGGQKINKTNNKVVLLHNPTQLRVECQETRSLQQNRKIARRRLRLKLDEFLHGSQSRTGIKAEKASSKKAKAKARSRARNRRKAEAKEATTAASVENEQSDI